MILKKTTPLFVGLPDDSHVYFVHSYHLETEADIVSATTFYGKEVQIAAQKRQCVCLTISSREKWRDWFANHEEFY